MTTLKIDSIANSIAFTIIALSTLFGIRRGFTHISLNLCLWVLVSIAIARFRVPVAAWIGQYTTSPILAQITSSFAILIGVIIIGSFLSARIVQIVHTTALRRADSLLGGLLGFIRGIVFVIIFFFIVTLRQHTTLQELGSNNQLTPFIQFGVNQLEQLTPSLGLNFDLHSPYNNFNDVSNDLGSIVNDMP